MFFPGFNGAIEPITFHQGDECCEPLGEWIILSLDCQEE